MTIRIRGNSFQVDVVIHSRISPTGERLRVRASFPSYAIAKRMHAIIRGDLIKTGTWARDLADYSPRVHCDLQREPIDRSADLRQAQIKLGYWRRNAGFR